MSRRPSKKKFDDALAAEREKKRQWNVAVAVGGMFRGLRARATVQKLGRGDLIEIKVPPQHMRDAVKALDERGLDLEDASNGRVIVGVRGGFVHCQATITRAQEALASAGFQPYL